MRSHRLFPSPVLVAAAGLVLTVGLVAAVAYSPATADRYFQVAVGVGVAGAVFALVRAIDPALTMTVGLGLSVFSGNWSYVGLPFGIDRVIMVAAVLVVLADAVRAGEHRRFVLRPVHWLLLVASLYAVSSAVWVDTLSTSSSFFELLDRFGIVPFMLFLAAPAVFNTPERRGILLGGLVVLGAYLGLTAFLEGAGAKGLVLPSYIADDSIGIHPDRARGPFLEAGANGDALFVCAVACAIAIATWQRIELRALAGAVGLLCLAGTVFTLTRQVWLAAVVAVVITLIAVPRLRRYLIPTVVSGAILVLGLLNFVPSLASNADARFTSQRPLWDRLNSNRAALNMIAERPLLGFGWSTFRDESERYYQLGPDYPLTTVSNVHSVFLSNGAELGLVGTSIWLGAVILAFGGAITRRGPPEHELWRAGFIAVLVAWLVIANFTPLTYGFSNYVVWMWAGVVYANFGPVTRTAAIHRGSWKPDPDRSTPVRVSPAS